MTESERKEVNNEAAEIVKSALAGKGESIVPKQLVQELEMINYAIEPIAEFRANVEDEMKSIAKTLPVWWWVDEISGFGPMGLAVIVGEAGNLSNYPKKGHLWKRFGLAPYKGKAASTWRMSGGLSAEDWTELGYSPNRRAEIYSVVADPIIKKQSRYRQLYLGRLAHEHAKALKEGLIPATGNKSTVESWARRDLPELTLVKKFEGAKHRGAAHLDFRANRYMTKILLRDLHNVWKGCIMSSDLAAREVA